MYQPGHFRQTETHAQHALMRAHPLATLITHGATGICANPLPFLLVTPPEPGVAVLRTHLARANPQLADLRTGGECVVVFHGPNAYVSPNWYPTKAENHKAVPTWNYAVVQVRGRPQVHEDPTWLRQLLTDLTAEHEQHQPQPWRLDDAPPDYLQAMIGAVVGVEIALTQVDGKFKLSQNRSAADQAGVRDGLQRAGALATRALMPPTQ